MDKKDYKVFTVLGDGELPEGSNWEAALSAAHYKLDNLCAIIDKNGLQISGPTSDVCNTDPIDKKFEAFGWEVRHVDGHDLKQLKETFDALPFAKGKPSLVIAQTVKGKGISYMENQLRWHHGVPTAEQYVEAIQELDFLEGAIQ
jgi:transketolase